MNVFFFFISAFFLILIAVTIGNVPSPNAPLKRVLAYTGCFSRMQTIKEIHEYLSQRLRIKEEDMRLWLYNSEVRGVSRIKKSPNSVLNPHFIIIGGFVYTNFSENHI